MQDDDAEADFTPEDEDMTLRIMQISLGMGAKGVEAIEAPVERFAQDQERRSQAAAQALNDAAQLPSDQKLSTASNVVFNEGKNAIKDVGAAAFRVAMTFAPATAPHGSSRHTDQSATGDPFEQGDEPPAEDDPHRNKMMAQPSAVEVRQQKRHFAVKLSGGPLQVGCTVYMSCSLALRAPTDKRMATSVAELDLSDPSVAFVCSAEGFDVTSATSVSVNILPEKDTGSVIFELLVREANRYRITITAYQRGVIRGQLVVADPAAYMSQSVAVVEKSGETPTVHRQPPMDSEWSELATQPSLSLDLHGPDKSIVGTSPHGILDWHAKDLGPWRAEAEKVIEIARDHVSGLYADPPDPDEVDREFIVLGQQIARVIPEALAKALMDDRLKFLSLQVTAAFDFPLELCTVHKPGLDELVQDRMSVARWFTNTRAIQLNRIHQVSNIALVIGKMREDSTVETEAMDVTAPAHRSTFDTRRTLIDEVFKTRRFDLMHYFGHSGAGEQKGPQIGRYLSFARDERTLRLQDIGAVEAERAFFSRSPLIVLNCCEGIQTSALLGGPESFPHSFIDNACIACIGTIWPIDSRAGNRFMTALYEHLAKDDFLHIAVMKARRNLLDRARHRDTPADEKLYLTLAARAYVYYGPPDLRCKFVERTP